MLLLLKAEIGLCEPDGAGALLRMQSAHQTRGTFAIQRGRRVEATTGGGGGRG